MWADCECSRAHYATHCNLAVAFPEFYMPQLVVFFLLFADSRTYKFNIFERNNLKPHGKFH